jgi:hypothetical protein
VPETMQMSHHYLSPEMSTATHSLFSKAHQMFLSVLPDSYHCPTCNDIEMQKCHTA